MAGGGHPFPAPNFASSELDTPGVLTCLMAALPQRPGHPLCVSAVGGMVMYLFFASLSYWFFFMWKAHLFWPAVGPPHSTLHGEKPPRQW